MVNSTLSPKSKSLSQSRLLQWNLTVETPIKGYRFNVLRILKRKKKTDNSLDISKVFESYIKKFLCLDTAAARTKIQLDESRITRIVRDAEESLLRCQASPITEAGNKVNAHQYYQLHFKWSTKHASKVKH